MLLYAFVLLIVCAAMPAINAAPDCSKCKLDEKYNEKNGYYCFGLHNGRVACSCPDQRYKLEEPCRICDRPGICGDANSACSEISSTSLLGQNSQQHFACFCSDTTFHIGKACPATPTTALPTIMTTAKTTIPTGR